MFLPTGFVEKVNVNDNVSKVNKTLYNAVPHEIVFETFDGVLTGYGPDCKGCSGKTASGYDVRNGNIYFDDVSYGNIRIIAADKKYPLGTIMRITVSNILDEPITAIVLDRGGAIKNNKVDLLYEAENSTQSIGRQKNVKFEILRYGW
jgi:3D (Asp-Asp-Asp) domain-containing protein